LENKLVGSEQQGGNNEQTCIFGYDGGCRGGRYHEDGLCGDRNAIRPNRCANLANPATLGTATRSPLSGFSS